MGFFSVEVSCSVIKHEKTLLPHHHVFTYLKSWTEGQSR